MGEPTSEASGRETTLHAEALETMARWVAAIADQVKNPVAAIGAGLDLINEQFSACQNGHSWQPETVEKVIALSRRRLEQLNTYISELADFAKPANIVASSFDPRPMLSRVVEKIRESSPLEGTVTINLGESVSTLYCDQTKIPLILTALVTNALEACAHRDCPRVEIALVRRDSADSGTVLTVADNGEGVPDELRASVVKPFYSRKEAGTGLGLSIVDKYARAHSGWLTIEPSPRLGGAAVSVFFPDPKPSPNRS